MTYKNEEDKLALISRLEDTYKAIVEKPTDPASIATISTVWNGLRAIQSSEAETNIINRFQRRCVMFTTYGAWFWLDGWILEQCKKILQGAWIDSANWLFKLVKRVEMMRSLRQASKEFDPTEFGIDLPSRSYTYNSPPAQWDTTIEAEHNKIISITIEILQHWLCFPTGKEAKEGRKKAWFIYVLIRELGEDVLILNQTWTAFNQTKNNMFSAVNSSNPALFECALPFREAARRHPLHDKLSEEYSALSRVGDLLRSMRNGSLYKLVEGHSHAIGLPVDRVPDEARYISDKKFEKFLDYVHEMLVLDRVGLDGIASPSRIQKEVANNPDSMMPFREHAPGRLRLMGDDGPFSTKTAATREGVFSALIWRGITFATNFSRDEDMVFDTLDDWNQKVREVRDKGANRSYICNSSAYGIHNSGRGPEHAEAYWRALDSNDWPLFVKEGPVEFMECYKFFYTKSFPARFPQIGALCGYLLAADYAYTELVCKPTLEEVGSVIRTINRGGASGLEILGLIETRSRPTGTKSTPGLEECQEGVRRVHAFLESHLSQEEWNQGHFDSIVIEHLLCKYSKRSTQSIMRN